jgi:hypothetical protein
MEGVEVGKSRVLSSLMGSWPEKTSRKLIVIVLAALLIGVPSLSLVFMSPHIEHQTITLKPGSHRAVHLGMYGFGTIEYSVSQVSVRDVYMIELDRANYYRFLAGEPYQYSMYGIIGGMSSESGIIWDQYIVFVNDGPASVQITFELKGTAYLSIVPVAAILATSSVAGYVLGRLEDKNERLDMADPIMMARKSGRSKAIAVMAALSILPVGMMLVIPFILPPTGPMFSVGELWGFFLGLLFTVIISFQLRFRLTTSEYAPDKILADLAYRLRISRYRVTQQKDRLIVRISSTSAVHIMARKDPNGTKVLYKPSATPSGFAILIVLILVWLCLPLAMALSLFMLYRASVFAGMRILPRMSQEPIPEVPDVKTDTHRMIVESLSEGRRLSSEAYECARSNYHDAVIVAVAFGFVLSAVVVLLAYFQAHSDHSGEIALAAGISSAVIFSGVSWFLLHARSKSDIAEFRSWSTKFDLALSRESAGQNPPDDEQSSFELIVSSFKEMPKWMKARRRAGGYRRPFFWLALFFLSYGAFEAGLVGAFMIAEGQLASSIIAAIVCGTLIALGVLAYRVWRNRLNMEMKQTLSDWNARYDAIQRDMEKLLAGD